MVNEEAFATTDNGTEQVGDPSMADAFDFDVPEGGPDDLSDLSDDKEDNSAQDDTGDDKDSAGDDKDEKDEQVKEESIDPKLLVRAGRMGLSDEETDRIVELGTNTAISNMLDILETRKGSSASSTGQGASEEEKAEWYEFSDEQAEEFAPELVEVLKTMNGSTKKAVEQIAGKYESQLQKMSEMLASRDSDAFEDAIESLGKDWQPVFGKGEPIDGKSEYARNIQRVRKAVFSDEYKGSVARRVREAAKDIFVEHSNKLANDVKVDKARDRQGKFIGRTAQRTKNTSDLTPRQRAIANAHKFMSERKMDSENLDMADPYEDL